MFVCLIVYMLGPRHHTDMRPMPLEPVCLEVETFGKNFPEK